MKRSVFNVGTIFRHALSSSSKNYADKASTLNVSLILSERRCFLSTLVCAGDEEETTDEELREILVNHSRHARGRSSQRKEWWMWPTRACGRSNQSSCIFSDVDLLFEPWLQAICTPFSLQLKFGRTIFWPKIPHPYTSNHQYMPRR